MDANFFATIHQTLSRHPEQVLVVWPAAPAQGPAAVSYTGRAILERVQTIRQALADARVRPAQAVLLALPVSLDLIAGVLACMALGAVPVLLPAAASAGAVPGLMRRGHVRAVLVPRPLRWPARLLARTCGVQLVALSELPEVAAAVAEAGPVPGGQAALVSHSSGSTGQPKAIRRSHAVLLAQHQAIKRVFPPWAGQRDFPLFPNVLLHNLAAGVVSILPDVPWCHDGQFDPARVVAQLVRERVQTLTGNVAYFRQLLTYLAHYPTPLPEVLAVGIGGSPVPEPLAQELRRAFPGAAVHIIYGASEAEPIAVREVTSALVSPLAGYCVGPVHPGLHWRIRPLGTLRRGAGPGPLVGEIQVSGPHVATPQPGQWLSTGDFGYVAHGLLYLTGRLGNEQLHEGVQHYQIEHLLYHLPGVERVAARAEAAGFTVFVQGSVSRAAVAELLAQHFSPTLCRAIHFRPSLPVDARHHSKILYAQLR
ncbi:AMP-binding protein [Hymenobacter rubripertinctus]|uniref:AMP-binding protein n=1 Tax=Hymenobacter rubripertinctus TaxID=2029981 RepID=UPI00160257A0|nr:AMP-binding protein [Hymenobacter rubripertinctus]